MEDGDELFSNPNQTSSSESNLQKKQSSILERLTNRNQTRLQNSISRKSDSNSDSSNATSSFLSHFSDSKHAIESKISNLRLSPPEPSKLQSQLHSISSSISDLEKLIAEISYSLPSYEIRSSLNSISELKQNLDILTSDLVPKKKFSFKNKGAKKNPTLESKNKDSVLINKETSYNASRDSPGFRDKEGEVLVKDFRGLEIGEFSILGLGSCEVNLIGSVRALFVHKLRNCRVFTGPVIGSILIDDVEGCVFVMASHQIRIHNAKKCDFYLRVRSRPIIEDSSSVRFAPYCLSYEGIEDDLRDASLGEETGNWENVDDFRWLRAVQSPNWSVLPETERTGVVEISTLED